MSTIRRHIDDIKEKISNFHPTDDLNVPEEFILEKMNQVRETLIRREIETGKSLDEYYQFDCCYEIKCQKTACKINGITFTADKALYYIDTPEFIPGIDKPISFLGDQDGRQYSRLSFSGFMNQLFLGAAGTLPAYTIVGNKIWIKNPTVSGKVFACMNVLKKDPQNPCQDWDVPYPVPSRYNLELLVTKDILSSYGIYIDDNSDNKDDRIVTAQAYKQQQQAKKKDD